ncbi:MAG: lipid A export permease/ATP-binding protein MsbA [Magnetococcales bacterium]|nr:lipid A export permease/ATP-binding protein MsbA [Magnetococcales bacterium]
MNNKALLHRFWEIVWPYRWKLLPAMLGMIVLAATNGAIAYLVQPILDQVFIKQDRQMLMVIPLAVLGIFMVRGVAYYVQTYMMEMVGHRVVQTLQLRIYRHMLTLDLSFFLSTSTGALISRITNDTTLLKGAASTVISNILREGMTVVFLLGVVVYRDWSLSLIAMLGLPLAGYLIYRFGRRMRKLSRTRQELMEGVVTHLEQTISGLRIVKAFCMEEYEQKAFTRVTEQVLTNNLRAAVVRSLSNPSMDLISGVAVCGVILYGGQTVIDGQTTTGNFFSFMTALLMAYTPIKRFTGLNNSLQESLAAARRIFDFLDIEPDMKDAPQAVELPPIQRELRFEGVWFSYGEGLDPVLKNIELTVRAGERVALVGKSGSGKSTLVHLVPRFFDVQSGRVSIDGCDIRDCSMLSLRSQIAMVTQEVILFNDTIGNNIAYGASHSTREAVEQAARDANILDFILGLPEGFDTEIGDRGIKLSGGQRQRLSIARSLLRNAPILILDEATSALDSESELAVQEALERLMTHRTTLVIAHRLSTIRSVDRIVVLREGEIVEIGNHAELIALDGEYARLHALQFREPVEEGP